MASENDEEAFVLTQGIFVNKKPLTHSPRLKWDLFTLMRALRISVARGNGADVTKFAAEIALTSGGMLLFREMILLAGEMASLGYVTFVPSLLRRLNLWFRGMVKFANGLHMDTFVMNEAPLPLRAELLDIARQLVAMEKDFVCDTLGKFVVYNATGALELMDLEVKPPIINNDGQFAHTWQGVAGMVAKALTAMICGIHSRDETQAVRCAMYACVWSHPDDVWRALIRYAKKVMLPDVMIYILTDLEMLYSLYVHVTIDRTVIPMQPYWNRARVFIVRAILMLIRLPRQEIIAPALQSLADGNVAQLFNASISIHASEVDDDYLPQTGRFAPDVVKCIPPNRRPENAAKAYLYISRDPDAPLLFDSSGIRDSLLKLVAVAYQKNQTAFGVRSCFVRFEDAFRFGCNIITKEFPGFRIAADIAKEFNHSPGRHSTPIDGMAGMIFDTLVETAVHDRYPPIMAVDGLHEYMAMFREGSQLDSVKDAGMWAMVRGPYPKSGAHLRLRIATALRNVLGFTRTWLFMHLRVRNQTYLGFRLPWQANGLRPGLSSVTDLFRDNKLVDAVRPVSLYSFLLQRYILELPATKRVLYVIDGELYANDDNISYAADEHQKHKLVMDASSTALAGLLMQNIADVHALMHSVDEKVDLGEDAMRIYPNAASRIDKLRSLNKSLLLHTLCDFLIQLPETAMPPPSENKPKKKRRVEEGDS